MTRRRLILAIVAAVVCGVASWLSLDRRPLHVVARRWIIADGSAPSQS
jgi:hypothetical protein